MNNLYDVEKDLPVMMKYVNSKRYLTDCNDNPYEYVAFGNHSSLANEFAICGKNISKYGTVYEYLDYFSKLPEYYDEGVHQNVFVFTDELSSYIKMINL